MLRKIILPNLQDMPSDNLRVGFDLVQISRIAESIETFGDQFRQKIFTADELAYAMSGEGLCAERLTARFAAKEAVIKALQLTHEGVNWRDIEVCKLRSGDCSLALHGHVADLAATMGVVSLALSLSHDGDYAGAFVMASLRIMDSDQNINRE